VDILDRINSIQLDINKAKTQLQDKQFKKHEFPKGKRQESSQNDQKHGERVIKPQHNNVPCFHQKPKLDATANKSILFFT
jgi:hypothetical protein